MKPGIHSVKQDASNYELQKAIEAAQPYAVKQMADRAKQFKGATEKETCKKIFDYLKHNIKYKADGDEQQVRLPSGLIRTGTGDCKSYALFTSAVLSNLGIPHSLTYASYSNDKTPTHVYVTTKNGCIVDAVWGKFNSEKQANHKINKPMNISYIAGVRSPKRKKQSYSYHTGIGATESGLEWAKRNGILPNKNEAWLAANSGLYRKYAAQKVLAVAIIGRGVYRKLIEKNAGGLANSLYKLMMQSRTANPSDPAYQKMRALEINFLEKGGNPNELYESIIEGNSKTPTGKYFHKLMQMQANGYTPNVAQWIAAYVSFMFGKKYDPATGKISGSHGIYGDPATDAAAGAAAAPWWAVLLKDTIVGLGGLYIAAKVGGPDDIPTDQTGSGSGSGQTPPTNNNQSSSSINPLYIVAAAGAAYLLLKKK